MISLSQSYFESDVLVRFAGVSASFRALLVASFVALRGLLFTGDFKAPLLVSVGSSVFLTDLGDACCVVEDFVALFET